MVITKRAGPRPRTRSFVYKISLVYPHYQYSDEKSMIFTVPRISLSNKLKTRFL